MNEETKVVTKEIETLENEFLQLLQQGISALLAAGHALVRLLDADPEALPRLTMERHIPRETLNTLARLGRGELLPEFAFKPCMRRLPISEQRRIQAGAIEAVVLRDGGTELIRVDVRNAEPAMQDQVLADDHIRTPPEQVQYLAAQGRIIEGRNASLEGSSWRVAGGKIDILRPVRLTRSDLKTMQRALGK